LVVRVGVPGGSLAAAESVGVDKDLRRKVEAAIAGLAFRVTAGDVAARAGVSLADAEAALRALAADSMATLNVSSDGEVLYVFRENFRALVRSKSLVIKLEPIADGAKMAAAYLARVSFGTALIVSIVVVFAALVVLSSSAGDRDSRGRGRSSSAFMYSRMPMRFSIFDYYVSFWDPFYYRRVQERARNNQPLNMLEGICSFVFGDGDPNFDRDDRKWILIARAIRSHKGVVAAEQLRPFLDVASNSDASDASGLVDESYMIPVLQKFSGEAKVDGDGNIVYVFPDIMTTTNTATDTAVGASPSAYLSERRWALSRASDGQKAAAVGLGLANVFGLVALNNVLGASAMANFQIAQSYGGVVALAIQLLPWLNVYAVGYFLVPATRWLLNTQTNKKIDARNGRRLKAMQALSPGRIAPALKKKLASARRFAPEVKRVTEREAVFSSDKQLSENKTEASALDEFDKKLAERTQGSSIDADLA